MSAFAVTLDELIASLDRFARSDASPLDAARRHLDRATIRLERAYDALKQAGARAPAELLARLKGRTQELEAALAEVGGDLTGAAGFARLAASARKAVEQIEDHLVRATANEEGPRNPIAGHSRTPSADLPRRVPAQSAAPASRSDQEQHKVSLKRQEPVRRSEQPLLGPGQGDNAIAARRAKALSDSFFLSRLAAGQVPAKSSLSNVLRASLASRKSSSSSKERDLPSSSGAPGSPAVDLEQRIRFQLRRAYFNSFRPVFNASYGASRDPARPEVPLEERQTAWSRLARDLVDATLPLIPSKLRVDRTLYPDSTNGSTMREAVEQDLTSPVVGVDERSSAHEHPSFDRAHFASVVLDRMARLTRVLQRLCAPARDSEVQSLLDALERAGTTPRAPEFGLVDLVEKLLILAKAMKGDLARFRTDASERMIGAMSEADLRKVIEHEAAELERETVTEWCGGEEGVRSSLLAWVGRDILAPSSDPSEPGNARSSSTTRVEFVRVLLDSLFSTQSVALPDLGQPVLKPSRPPMTALEPADLAGGAPAASAEPPPTSPSDNILPPPLVVLAPLLFELQNLFQALGILAAIAMLVASTFGPANDPPTLDLLFQRLWTILAENISPAPSLSMNDMLAPDSISVETPDRGDSTRLANLADELISYISQPTNERAPPDASTAERIRAGVNRILRYEDPVWKLLMRRLRDGAEAALLRAIAAEDSRPNGSTSGVPSILRTGRANSTRPTPAAIELEPERPAPLVSPIKGFERPPFLAAKVEEVLQKKLFVGVYQHVEQVWGRIFGWVGGTGVAATHV